MAAAQVAQMRNGNNNNNATNLPLQNHNNNNTLAIGNKNKTIMTSPHNLEGITPLMLACQQGRVTDVRTLLKKKGDAVRDRTRSEKVALHFCAEGGSVDCLEAVLEGGANMINAQDEEGYSPIHLAVINGNKDCVKAFIAAKADLNTLDNEKHSLVHWATVCGELEILDILLTRGAPATTPDIHLAHPIHYAAQMCGNVNGLSTERRSSRVQSTLYGVSPKKGLLILRRLLQHGVPIDVRDQDGRQPLLWAASAGSADAILSLVNAGAFVEAEDKDGLTALHCAASRGHTDCLETLIALCGAEVDVIDKNGCSALFYAITLGHADCTELLLNFGAEPNRQDRKGRTPAHCGASKGQLETIKLYAKHEGNLWMRNVRGDLPIHEAVISRRKDLVTWLISQRPDTVNAPNNDGRCPIHLAALNNNVEMVKILIDHHANVNPLMRTGKGISMTPLDAAIHRGNSAVAKFLQLHGGLPANSLNDAALHRRLNRSLDSQARSGSSLHGSQLGNHHEQSPDNETRVNFMSPEVMDASIIRQYAHSVSGAILSESSRMVTSTPIMTGSSMQTDSRHYLRDMEVQVSEDFSHHLDTQVKETFYEEIRSNVAAAASATGSKAVSAQSSRKSEKKVRRKRSSREKSSVDSTDSDTVKKEMLISRSSRRSRSRKSSDSSPTLKTATTNGNGSTETSKTTDELATEKGRKSTEDSSDNFHNDSEKFSELENVAIPSSESEIREEDLQAAGTEAETPKPGSRHSKTKSVSPDKKSRPQSSTKSTPVAKAEADKESDVPDLSNDETSRKGSPAEPTKSRKSSSLAEGRVSRASASRTPISRIVTPGGQKSRTPSASGRGRSAGSARSSRGGQGAQSRTPDKSRASSAEIHTATATGHRSTSRSSSRIKSPADRPQSSKQLQPENEYLKPQSPKESTTQDSSTEAEATTVVEVEFLEVRSEPPATSNPIDAHADYVQDGRPRPTVPFSEQSSESKESETLSHSPTSEHEHKSEDTDDVIYENQLNQISLQEAAERRRRSRSKSMSQSPLSTRSVKRKVPPPTNPNYLRTPKNQSPKSKSQSQSPGAKQEIGQKVKKAERSPNPKPSSKTGPKKTAEALEEEEIRLQEELIALRKKGTAELNKYSKSKIPTGRQPRIPNEYVNNHVHVPELKNNQQLLGSTSMRQRNPSESNRSNQSDELGVSNRDSGYSDQVLPITSASEDQSRIKMGGPTKSTGSIRRRVLSKRPKSSNSSVLKKSGALSSASKVVPKTSRDRKRFETTFAAHGSLSQENGGEDTTSHGGSATSEEDGQTRHRRERRNTRPRSKLTFTKGEDIRNSSARLSPPPQKPVDVPTPISVTQAMQASMRKYHLERKIFQELLELKRHQIRAGKANEQILVKRLSDGYKKAGLSINFRDYEGPYTFRNFEKYLYDQLRLLQANRRILPRFAPSDDLEKLSNSLKKMNATKLPFLEDEERCEAHGDHSQCTLSTHRCHHAAHAYTGVPCAAYSKGKRTGFLPRVDPLKAPGPTQNDPMTRNLIMNGATTPAGVRMIVTPLGEPESPITLEVQQGAKTQVYALPSQSLDPTKNYYVSLSIRPTPSPPVPLDPNERKGASTDLRSVSQMSPDNSGQMSAPPPPLGLESELGNLNSSTNTAAGDAISAIF